MKKLFTLILSITTLGAYCQCDDSYFPFEKGVSFEQTGYNKKGKEQGKTISTVLEINASSATIKNVFYDTKGEEVINGDYTIVCEGSTIKIDFSSFIPEGILNQYGDAEITVEGDFITIPSNLETGLVLPDGSGTINIKMAGPTSMNIKMDMTITDRKVEKMEKITTSAGSFDTYKITQIIIAKMNMLGMKKTTESSSASWFAKKVGMVKTESYNKKGDMISYTLLTSFTKN